LQPTAGQLKAYQEAMDNYNEAVASGSETKITRTLNALKKSIGNITAKTEHVVKLTNAEGEVTYFNYTDAIVLVPQSELEYFVIPAQSYVMN
jgi:ABC-type Zn uptake system ZnuABC Zn-binding protein ZnuA